MHQARAKGFNKLNHGMLEQRGVIYKEVFSSIYWDDTPYWVFRYTVWAESTSNLTVCQINDSTDENLIYHQMRPLGIWKNCLKWICAMTSGKGKSNPTKTPPTGPAGHAFREMRNVYYNPPGRPINLMESGNGQGIGSLELLMSEKRYDYFTLR